ncbi:hypothetical protein Tco_0986759 [Tanacetum coccineum]
MTTLTNSTNDLKNMLGQFMKMNIVSTSGSGTLPSNTITNPREDLKGITTRSGVAYKGPTIPTTSSSPKVVERETEPVIAPVVEPVEAPVSAPKPNPKPSIPYPSRLNDQKLCQKANNQMEKIFQIFQDLHFDISFADALILMPKFASTIKGLLSNKEKLFELARTPLNEHFSAVILKKLPKKLGVPGKFLIPCDFTGMDVCLALADLGASINLMPLSVWKNLSLPELTPTYEPISLEVDDLCTNDFRIGDILLLEKFLNDDPSSPSLPPQELKVVEPKNKKSSTDEPPEVELKDLPPHLEYAFLEGTDKLPVIIAKDLKDEEKAALIKVLKSHKQAIAWKLSDIKGINPEFCTHKILIEDDFKPAVQHQRRVNPKIYEVIKKEVIKLLDAGLIYPISDSPWVSPVHCVPKKGGFTVVENEENELIPTRLVTGWRRQRESDTIVFSERVSRGNLPLPFGPRMKLKLVKDTNLCLNWEKSHFMVKEGIVLGHKISKNGIDKNGFIQKNGRKPAKMTKTEHVNRKELCKIKAKKSPKMSKSESI